MNQMIRSLGVGITLGAYFMLYGLNGKSNEASNLLWGVDLKAIVNPITAHIQTPGVAVAVWVSLCLGLGVFAGGLLWPRVERLVEQIQCILLPRKQSR